jgi:hypothetical protein
MNKKTIFATTVGVSVLSILIAEGAATAAPTGGSRADDTVKWLQDQGYHVVLNGTPNGPLAQCVATGVHGMRDSKIDPRGRQIDPTLFTTVYVDVSCNTTT